MPRCFRQMVSRLLHSSKVTYEVKEEVKKEKFDELGLPLSDQVKIVKKFREMGL
jgi:hypothetical protein